MDVHTDIDMDANTGIPPSAADVDVTSVVTEKGGVGKTTTTVGLAKALADLGVRVGVVDMDPRATATTWLNIEAPRGGHVVAILTTDDVAGAAADLAQTSPWHPNITVIPGHRDVAAVEAASPEYGEPRLRNALKGWGVDVVLIDTPNRQGGFLIRSILTATRRVLYTTTPDEDGRDGVRQARLNLARFAETPLNPGVEEIGIVVTRWPDVIPSRDALSAIDALRSGNPDMVLEPFVPERVAVRSARKDRTWWDGDRGKPVAAAFEDLAAQIWPQHAQETS